MTFKQWMSLFEIDANRMSSDQMGTVPFDAGVGKYEIDDNLFVPDNAQIEFISRFVTQTAGMFWAFKKTVREALLHKVFADAVRQFGNPFSQDGQLNRHIVTQICQKLRLDQQQCLSLAQDHRFELRTIASQLAA